MPKDTNTKANYPKKTGKFEPMGHTAGPYGNDPAKDAKGVANKPARDLDV